MPSPNAPMTSVSPIPCVWIDDAFRPVPRFLALCRETYGDGEYVTMAEVAERSPKSHAHFFATLHDCFATLPEGEDRWPTELHFRKNLLIRAGWCDVVEEVCGSRAEAERWLERLRRRDSYAVVTLRGNVLTTYTAKSQSHAAMKAPEFQAVKTRVFEILGELLGVELKEAA